VARGGAAVYGLVSPVFPFVRVGDQGFKHADGPADATLSKIYCRADMRHALKTGSIATLFFLENSLVAFFIKRVDCYALFVYQLAASC
jgi:hypothetical protein